MRESDLWKMDKLMDWSGIEFNSEGEIVKMRKFDGGATRDDDTDKPDYEGFLSPEVLAEYARYMHKNRKQSDGELRASDNWQKGIPKNQYMKSAWRHFMQMWRAHRNEEPDMEAMCALLFNVMGYMYEEIMDPALIKECADVKHATHTLTHATGKIVIDLKDLPDYFQLPNGVRYEMRKI